MVEAAERVLVQHGIARLTTNRVAEVAGVSIGSLYQYFPNKEAIVSALFDRHLARIHTLVRGAIDDGNSIEDIVGRLAMGMLRASVDREIFGHLWELRTAADAHERIAAHVESLVDSAAAALIRLGMASAEDAPALGFVIVYAGDGIANAVARSKRQDVARIAAMYADLIVRYFQARTSAR